MSNTGYPRIHRSHKAFQVSFTLHTLEDAMAFHDRAEPFLPGAKHGHTHTGHRYVSRARRSGYYVRFKSFYAGTRATLEDALALRDATLWERFPARVRHITKSGALYVVSVPGTIRKRFRRLEAAMAERDRLSPVPISTKRPRVVGRRTLTPESHEFAHL